MRQRRDFGSAPFEVVNNLMDPINELMFKSIHSYSPNQSYFFNSISIFSFLLIWPITSNWLFKCNSIIFSLILVSPMPGTIHVTGVLNWTAFHLIILCLWPNSVTYTKYWEFCSSWIQGRFIFIKAFCKIPQR